MPKAFISYSWEKDNHKKWVRELAERLRNDGVDVILDQWHLAPGDQLTEFMECSIRENDFVLIICTPHYKVKSDGRVGGVGYEGDIITSEVFTERNHRKFIPILRQGEWTQSAPTWLQGKIYVDLRGNTYSEIKYNDLLATIHNLRPIAPPVGRVPVERFQAHAPSSSTVSLSNNDIKIEGLLIDEVTVPKMDGTRGCALYAIPFKLSRQPSSLWERAFIATWNNPPRFSSMHRTGIARIQGDRVILDGTTIDEVERYHRDTLKLAVEKANEIEKKVETEQKMIEAQERLRIKKHEEEVRDAAKRIKFD